MTTSISEDRTPRVLTGVGGLDEILGGGLPARRLYLVQGSAGAGKTTLALQFLLEGARAGERALYISLSETSEEVRSVARSHGWSLEGITLFEGGTREDTEPSENTLFEPPEVELGERMHAILEQIETLKPSRVVLDSCSELRLLAQSPLRYRRQVLALKRHLVEEHRTVLLVDNPAPDSPDVLLQSLAHGVIILEQLSPVFGSERRRMRVLKMRGITYRGGYHDFTIRTGGIEVFPRPARRKHGGDTLGEVVSSGIAELDALLGGGPHRGTSTLIIGPAGAGKSLIGTQYAVTAARRGEPVAIFAFDEGRAVALSRARSVGLDLETFVANGTVTLQQIDPADLSAGEFAHAVRTAVDERGARVVVIDSLNGYLYAMPDEHALQAQLHELLSYLDERGVLTIIIVAQHGLLGTQLETPADVSYLADAVLLVRFFEAHGGVRKAISVLKKRTGGHERTIRELSMSPSGISVGAPLERFHGVLTGVPVFRGDGEVSA